MNDGAWSNMFPNDRDQCGCTSIRDCLEKATTVLAYSTEDPSLGNPVPNVVFPLGHQRLLRNFRFE